jgi:DNA-binding transcriptional MerR regulator
MFSVALNAGKPMEIEKRYYTIGEVAKKFGVATSLIRFWESQFDMIKPRKNKNGVRQYTKTDLDTLGTIYHLVKEKGYTLNGAQDILKNKPEIGETVELVDSLRKIRLFFTEMREQLDRQYPPETNDEDKDNGDK